MKNFILKANETEYLSKDKYYIVEKGKVVTRSILGNGKVVSNNNCLRKGDIIFNYFSFLGCEEKIVPEIGIEFEALEDSILREFKFSKEEILKTGIYQQLLLQLVKKTMIETMHQLYNAKGYMLMMLKIYSNSEGVLNRKEIKLDSFNVGKTQFYKLYKLLKKEMYLVEKKDKIYLDLIKINKFLQEEY